MSSNRLKRFGGIARLYGSESLERFEKARVCVVGVGGVGSWVVEALARSGIGYLTLIDMDHIAESNINRQLQALEPDIGKSKVRALLDRIANINPNAIVVPIEEFIEPDNLNRLIDPSWNWIIDCIDNSTNKAAMIAHCHKIGLNLVSVGGAGGRRDPTRVRIADLGTVTHDPLLAKTRTKLRREYGFTSQSKQRLGITCVYSDEQPIANPKCTQDTTIVGGLQCSGYGSIVTVTATFGFVAASVVLDRLAKHA